MSSERLHAPRDRLSRQAIALHHAIVSLMEEPEVADWYRQHAPMGDGPVSRRVA